MNGARNLLRAHRRHPTDALDEADPPPAPDTRPEDAAVVAEQLEQLQEALGRLPCPQREVLVLRVYGQMPFKEIARQQGTGTNTALGRYRHALDALRSMLNSEVRQ
jgi:RNA polymerase sigma factor (sigma-70 family)